MLLRMKLASNMNCMPYMVANNKTLLDLAKLKPTDKKDLLNSKYLSYISEYSFS